MRSIAMAILIVTTSLTPSSAAPLGEPDAHPDGRSYPGPVYAKIPGTNPTEFEPQSKLWFHDGAWWALMLAADGTIGVFELLPDHSWRPGSDRLTDTPATVGDVLSDDQGVDALVSTSTGLLFGRLNYEASTRRYLLVPSGLTQVSERTGATSTLTRDTTGRLWVAMMAPSEVRYTFSDTDGEEWSAPAAPSVPETDLQGGEIAAIAAFDESIGILWSDQARGQFTFAVHRDGSPDDEWSAEVALEGDGMVDDHISLKVVPGEQGDTLVAGIKTSQDELSTSGEAPLMVVLARSPDGVWSSRVAGTVADNHNRPLVVVDSENRELYFMANALGGDLYYKRASLDDLSFAPGLGTILAEGDVAIAHPTAGKEAVSGRTGLVVLAASADPSTYHHAELALPSSGEVELVRDDGPPPAPLGLVATANGPGSVALYWSRSIDTDVWVAAGEGTAAQEYLVMRDGVQVGSTGALSFVDRPATGAAAHDYNVVAVDGTGSRSEPSATASVTLASDNRAIDGTGALWWVLGGLGAAGFLVVIAVIRRRTGYV